MEGWDAWQQARIDSMHDDMEGADYRRRVALANILTLGFIIAIVLILWAAY